MRALYWNGVNDLRVGTMPDPEIVNPHDAILRVTASTTCGSDLHIIDGYIPSMKEGDILGHEFMGVVEEVGRRSVRPARGPGGGALVHRLQRVLVLPARALLPVRQHQSQLGVAGAVAWLSDRRHLRLYPRIWRLRGGARRVCPRAVRRQRLLSGARRLARRAGALSVWCRADRLHGGRFLRPQRGRNGCRLGVWRCRPDGTAKRVSARRGTRDRHRPLPRAIADGP